mmetsp:Transcript_9579/g.28845  ORF Transcript_9579/g.28845 Transcript_9579/m.28845 type:complete len:289 (-) Transcript_9579:365-1231(-)
MGWMSPSSRRGSGTLPSWRSCKTAGRRRRWRCRRRWGGCRCGRTRGRAWRGLPSCAAPGCTGCWPTIWGWGKRCKPPPSWQLLWRRERLRGSSGCRAWWCALRPWCCTGRTRCTSLLQTPSAPSLTMAAPPRGQHCGEVPARPIWWSCRTRHCGATRIGPPRAPGCMPCWTRATPSATPSPRSPRHAGLWWHLTESSSAARPSKTVSASSGACLTGSCPASLEPRKTSRQSTGKHCRQRAPPSVGLVKRKQHCYRWTPCTSRSSRSCCGGRRIRCSRTCLRKSSRTCL